MSLTPEGNLPASAGTIPDAYINVNISPSGSGNVGRPKAGFVFTNEDGTITSMGDLIQSPTGDTFGFGTVWPAEGLDVPVDFSYSERFTLRTSLLSAQPGQAKITVKLVTIESQDVICEGVATFEVLS